jgi:hypothetical protein
MSDELFPPEAVAMDSPRLAWIKRHGIVTFHSCPSDEWSTWMAGIQEWHPEKTDAADFFFEETSHNGDTRIGEGNTEDEAIAHLCRRHGVRLWNEEGA